MTVTDFPNAFPNFSIGFVGSKKLDPRITFTRATTATETGNGTGNVNGEVYTFPPNVPRLTSQGLLIEEFRTNQVLQSQDFANAAWAKPQRTSVTSNAGVAPDGTTTADLMFPNNLAGPTCDAFQSLGNVNADFANSVYAKASGKDWLRMTGAQGNLNAWFNVNTGTLGTVDAGITASIEAISNGWFRCSVVEENVTANFIFVTVCDADGSAAVTTNGTDGLLVWGGQFEEGDFPTSYIPTTTATVTRATDVANMEDVTGFFNADASTIIIEGNYAFWNGNYALFSFTTTPASFGNRLSYRPPGFYSQSTAGTMFNFGPGVPAGDYFGRFCKYAFTYNLVSANSASNYGVSTAVANVDNVGPVGITQGMISQLVTGFLVTGYVASITYYPTLLSDDALQALTTQQT